MRTNELAPMGFAEFFQKSIILESVAEVIPNKEPEEVTDVLSHIKNLSMRDFYFFDDQIMKIIDQSIHYVHSRISYPFAGKSKRDLLIYAQKNYPELNRLVHLIFILGVKYQFVNAQQK